MPLFARMPSRRLGAALLSLSVAITSLGAAAPAQAEGTIRIGCVDAGTFRPQRIPSAVASTLAPEFFATPTPAGATG